jgi:hypothetical protein
MNTEVDYARKAADCARNCAADYRTSLVTVRTITWSGARVGLGSATNSDLVLAKRLVRELSGREVHGSNGRYTSGDIVVEGITPTYDVDGVTGGYTVEQLDPVKTFTPQPELRREVRYIVTGDLAGEYGFVNLETGRIASWRLVLRRKRTTP